MKYVLLLLMIGVSANATVVTINSVKDLDAIKAACADPSSAGNQAAPTEIKINCKEIKTGWEQSADEGEISFNSTDRVISSATTDKPNAGAAEETVMFPADSTVFVCGKYVQFAEEASLMSNSNCEAVAGIDDLSVYCKDTISGASDASGGSIWGKTYTGLSVDTCPVGGPIATPHDPGKEPVVQDPGKEPVAQDPGKEPVVQDPGKEPVVQDPVQEPGKEPEPQKIAKGKK